MSLLNVVQSQKVIRAIKDMQALLDGEDRTDFVKAAKACLAENFTNAPPAGIPGGSLLALVTLLADLVRSNVELRKVVFQRGKLIEDLREICDAGRERTIFAQTHRVAIPRESDHR